MFSFQSHRSFARDLVCPSLLDLPAEIWDGRIIYASPEPGIYRPANFRLEVYDCGLYAAIVEVRERCTPTGYQSSHRLCGTNPLHADAEADAAVAYWRQFIAEWNACDVDDHEAALEADRDWEDDDRDNDFWDDTEPSQFVEDEY